MREAAAGYCSTLVSSLSPLLLLGRTGFREVFPGERLLPQHLQQQVWVNTPIPSGAS